MQSVLAHACNSSTWEAEALDFCKFKASLVFMVKSGLHTETLLEKKD